MEALLPPNVSEKKIITAQLHIRASYLIPKYKMSRIVYQTLCCGYSLESSGQYDSNEYPQYRDLKGTNGFRMPSIPHFLSSGINFHTPPRTYYVVPWVVCLSVHLPPNNFMPALYLLRPIFDVILRKINRS